MTARPDHPWRSKPKAKPATAQKRTAEQLVAAEANREIGAKPKLEWIELDRLLIDERYQRAITTDGRKRINSIVREFRWSRFHPLMVTGAEQRGSYCVIDGQHRMEAAKLHPMIDAVPCVIVEASSIAEQANAFVAMNRDRIAVSSVNIFWARLAAGEERATRLAEVCRQAGVTIARTAGTEQPPKTMSAIVMCERVLQLGERCLRLALTAIARAWPETRSAFRGALIQALGQFFRRQQDSALEPMVNVLSNADIGGLLSVAVGRRLKEGGSLGDHLLTVLTGLYQAGRAMRGAAA